MKTTMSKLRKTEEINGLQRPSHWSVFPKTNPRVKQPYPALLLPLSTPTLTNTAKNFKLLHQQMTCKNTKTTFAWDIKWTFIIGSLYDTPRTFCSRMFINLQRPGEDYFPQSRFCIFNSCTFTFFFGTRLETSFPSSQVKAPSTKPGAGGNNRQTGLLTPT